MGGPCDGLPIANCHSPEPLMTKYRARLLVLGSYFEVVKRVLKRKPYLSYGRNEFFARFWAEAAREVGAGIEPLDDNIFRISRAKRSTLVQFHYVNIDTYFNWMLVAQKPFICKLLLENKYPISRYLEYDIRSIDKAREFLREVSGNFVVKPRSGAGGGGVTTGVNSYKRLKRASITAAANFSQKLMIEEQVPGESFRLLFLNGEFIDAVKRCRPSVIGDGKRSIRELIDDENHQRRGAGPSRSLFELKPDLDCEFYMRDVGTSLTTIPAPREKIIVKNVANENSDRDNFTVRSDIHPDFLRMGKHISSLLGVKLMGIDLMTSDISIPLDQSGGVINEVNIPPGLHYHEMIANPEHRASVGTQILEYILSGPGIPMSLPSTSTISADRCE
jgi:cyanophycin synthetase